MSRRICMVWDLDAAMRASNEEKLSVYRGATLGQINRQIMLAYNAGMDVVPSCDDHDERGFCRGHNGNKQTNGENT